MQLHWEILS